MIGKTYLLFSLFLFCGIPAVEACGTADLPVNQSNNWFQESEIDITGKIIKVIRPVDGSNNKDFLGSIYVEGSGNYDRASINVNKQTGIFIVKNGKRQAASFNDLQIGATVQATFSGPVLYSYPVQATAAEIVILAGEKNDQNSKQPHDKTPYPLTKTEYIRVVGERRRIVLRLFDEVDLPFAAYYPESDFSAETNASGEGQSLRFIAKTGGSKNENAYVHIFFPYENRTLAQIRRLVSGNRGLLRTNGWRVRNVKPSENYNFAWAKEQIFFADQTREGFVLIGRQQKHAFYVIVYYPKEYAEGFLPRAEIILRNLVVKSVEYGAAGEVEDFLSLPAAIRAKLDKNYPMWKIARLEEDVKTFYQSQSKHAPPQLVRADFNGDNSPDYALNIIYRKNARIMQDFIVFINNGREFSERVLESFPFNAGDLQTGVFLVLRKKGEKAYNHEAGKTFRFRQDAPEIVYFEKASTAYILEKGRFRSIITSD